MSIKHEGGTSLQDRQRDEVKEPPKYRVVLHNDDYTPQDFVVALLIQVFRHEASAARRIMMKVHRTGAGTAGVYTREVAETKTEQSLAISRSHDYPLEVTFEPDA